MYNCLYGMGYVCKFPSSIPSLDLYQLSSYNLTQNIDFYVDITDESLGGSEVPGFKVDLNNSQHWLHIILRWSGSWREVCTQTREQMWTKLEEGLRLLVGARTIQVQGSLFFVNSVEPYLQFFGNNRDPYPGSFVSWWAESHTYKASLLTEGAMEMMEENDTLVVELTAATWGGELFVGRGGQSPSDMIEKRHVLHKEELTWEGAEQVIYV